MRRLILWFWLCALPLAATHAEVAPTPAGAYPANKDGIADAEEAGVSAFDLAQMRFRLALLSQPKEAGELLEEALANLNKAAPDANTRALALVVEGWLRTLQGDHQAADALLDQLDKLLAANGAISSVSRVHWQILRGWSAIDRQDWAAAIEEFERIATATDRLDPGVSRWVFEGLAISWNRQDPARVPGILSRWRESAERQIRDQPEWSAAFNAMRAANATYSLGTPKELEIFLQLPAIQDLAHFEDEKTATDDDANEIRATYDALRGLAAYQLGEYLVADRYLRNALSQGNEIPDATRDLIVIALAVQDIESGRVALGLHRVRNLLSGGMTSTSGAEHLSMINTIITTLEDRGEESAALEFVEWASKNLRVNASESGDLAEMRARLQFRTRDYAAAITSIRRSIAMIRRTDVARRPIRNGRLESLARIEYESGDFPAAAVAIKRWEMGLEKPGAADVSARSLQAAILLTVRDPRGRQLIDEVRSQGELKLEARRVPFREFLHWVARDLLTGHQVDLAEGLLRELALSDSECDSADSAGSLELLARVALERHQTDRAVETFSRAADCFEKSNAHRNALQARFSIAVTLRDAGKIAEANRIALETFRDPHLEPDAKAAFGKFLENAEAGGPKDGSAKQLSHALDQLSCDRARAMLAAEKLPDPSALKDDRQSESFLARLKASTKEHPHDPGYVFLLLRASAQASVYCGERKTHLAIQALLLELKNLEWDFSAPDALDAVIAILILESSGDSLSENEFIAVAGAAEDGLDDSANPAEVRDLVARLQTESANLSANARMRVLRIALKNVLVGTTPEELSAASREVEGLLETARSLRSGPTRDVERGLISFAQNHDRSPLAPQAMEAAIQALDLATARTARDYNASEISRVVKAFASAASHVEKSGLPTTDAVDGLADQAFQLIWTGRKIETDSTKQARRDRQLLRYLTRSTESLISAGYPSSAHRIVTAVEQLGFGDELAAASAKIRLLLGAHAYDEALAIAQSVERKSLKASDLGDSDGIESAFDDAARLAYKRGEVTEAAALLQKFSKISASAHGAATISAVAPMTQSAVYDVCARSPRSRRHADEALSAIAKLDRSSALRLYWPLVKAFRGTGDFASAANGLSLMRGSIDADIAAGAKPTDLGRNQLIAWQGVIAFESGDKRDAVHRWSEALSVAESEELAPNLRPYALALMLTSLQPDDAGRDRSDVGLQLARALAAVDDKQPRILPYFALARFLHSKGEEDAAWDSLLKGVDALRSADYRLGMNANALAERYTLHAAAAFLQLSQEQADQIIKGVADPEFVLALAGDTIRDAGSLAPARQEAVVWAMQVLEDSATARDVNRAFARLSIANEALGSVLKRLASTDEALITHRSEADLSTYIPEFAPWMSPWTFQLGDPGLDVPCDAGDSWYSRYSPSIVPSSEEVSEEQRKAEMEKEKAEQQRAFQQREMDLLGSLDEDTELLEVEVPQLLGSTFRKPLSIAELRASMRDDQWLVVSLPAAESTYTLALSRSSDSFRYHRSTLGRAGVAAAVDEIRASLQLNAVAQAKPFAAAAAHRLYEDLFAPVLDRANQDDHLIWIASDALGSLPPYVLLMSPPARQATATIDDLRKLSWLANRFRFSVLPSLANFTGGSEKAGTLNRPPTLVFADPDFEGTTPECETPPGGKQPGGVVRHLCRLSETSDIPVRLARTFDFKEGCGEFSGGSLTCLLGASASEEKLRELSGDGSARHYQLIVLATHGFTAKETNRLAGRAEPAIALSSTGSTAETDGIVTSSEIAALDLSATLVMITACNSGDGDGSNDAIALSGLARAFFQAGTESVMASHWAVDQHASVFLVSRFAELARSNSLSQSLAIAMREMRSGARRELPAAFAHPAYWAPFVIVSRH